MKDLVKSALDRYNNKKIPTGDFLRAVLENNLLESYSRADEDNEKDLFEIVKYIYWEMPSICWGSKEKVGKWLSEKT